MRDLGSIALGAARAGRDDIADTILQTVGWSGVDWVTRRHLISRWAHTDRWRQAAALLPWAGGLHEQYVAASNIVVQAIEAGAVDEALDLLYGIARLAPQDESRAEILSGAMAAAGRNGHWPLAEQLADELHPAWKATAWAFTAAEAADRGQNTGPGPR